MRFYFGTPGWGWRLFGIGYKDIWFLGFSMRLGKPKPTIKIRATRPSAEKDGKEV